MSKVYIVLDDTEGKWVGLSSDMVRAVEDAQQYHDDTKNEIHIYYGELVGQIEQEEANNEI